MTVEYNLTNTESLSQAKSIDFASKFGNNINKLLEILGVILRINKLSRFKVLAKIVPLIR